MSIEQIDTKNTVDLGLDLVTYRWLNIINIVTVTDKIDEYRTNRYQEYRRSRSRSSNFQK